MAISCLCRKLFFSGAKAALQPQATCIRATTAGYLNIPGPSADGDSHRGLSTPTAQDAFDHGGSTPPYCNENDMSIIGPNLGLLA